MGIISTDLNKAKDILESEELVAIPTETVYGLAGNIYSEKAINLIFKGELFLCTYYDIRTIKKKTNLCRLRQEIIFSCRKKSISFNRNS